ncbi:hypothetical protein OBO34_12650, partial [Clostridiales Family XIII bacterium ASD5510]
IIPQLLRAGQLSALVFTRYTHGNIPALVEGPIESPDYQKLFKTDWVLTLFWWPAFKNIKISCERFIFRYSWAGFPALGLKFA